MKRAPTCILFNSVQQVMLWITIEKLNGGRRNFFHIVDERSSFELHARSFESPRLITIMITYLNPSAEVVINGCPGQLKN